MLHVLWVEIHLCSERSPRAFCPAVTPLFSSNVNEGRKSKCVRYENYFSKKAIMVSYLFSIAA